MKVCIYLFLIIPSCTYALSGDHLHQFMWANIDTFDNNPERALRRYQHIAHQSIWAYHGYIPFLFDHSKHTMIVSLAPKIDAHFPNHPHLQLLLALSFKKTNNNEEGNKRIARLSEKHGTDASIVLRCAQMYVDSKDYEKALTVLDKYLNKVSQKSNSFLFFFLKGQIYAQRREHDKALESIEKCLEIQPSYSQAWLMRAVLEEQKGNIENAIAGYSNFLNLTHNAHIQQHLMKLMMQQSVTHHSDAFFADKPYESHLEKAIIYFTKKQYHQALVECNKYLEFHQRSIKGKLLKVQIMIAQNNSKQAISFLCKEIDRNPDNDVWYTTLYHLRKKIDTPQQIEIALKNLAKKYPQHILPHLYSADIILRTVHPRNALPYLVHAESLAISDLQKIAVLYQQALLFYDSNDWVEAEKALKKIIAIEHSNPPACNLLAYLYAKKGLYDQAHSSITLALAHDPSNYHYLDTKGYIFYKQKKYAEAEKIFAEILPKCHNDATVLTHLKKVHTKQHTQEQDHQKKI